MNDNSFAPYVAVASFVVLLVFPEVLKRRYGLAAALKGLAAIIAVMLIGGCFVIGFYVGPLAGAGAALYAASMVGACWVTRRQPRWIQFGWNSALTMIWATGLYVYVAGKQ
jgi:hypothetical protein